MPDDRRQDENPPIIVDDGGNLTGHGSGSGSGAATALDKPQEGTPDDITKM